MAKLYNLARMTTATTGTGTITLGSAVSGYLSFADAGVSDADVVDYAIKDGSNSEIGTGTYTASGTTLTRTVTKSTNSNSAISLSGTAEVFISPRAETFDLERNRQNFLLSTAYQSKSLATYRRLVNLFATGFKGANDTANGIYAAGSSNYAVNTTDGYVSPTSSATSYANTGGSGNRTGAITMSGTATFAAGSSANLINGTQDDVAFFSTAQTTATLVFDFGSGNAKYIDEVKVYQSAATANGTWVLEGSNDNSSWTTGTGNVAFGSSATVTQAITWGSPATYRYYRLRQISGATSTGPYVREIEFKILAAVPSANDMTLETAAQTSDSSVSNARVLLEYNNTATPTINTDLSVEVTCDGGSNWATATLAAVTAYSQSGRKVVETADTACTAGTSFAARIKTANGKSVPIYALILDAGA